MMGRIDVLLLLLLMSITPCAQGTSLGSPGKPTLIRCRSPEKETFTCWWEPGSDGGLPTTFALYYRKESSDTVYECPDYHTAGENSCFFNKNDTSIWVNYNITVVATNALGSTFSDPVDVDVVYIVKPNPPEKVGVGVMEDKGWPFLRVSWEPPHKADTRSGWITLIYELRVRLDGEEEWEMHLAGQQKMFNIFSLRSGGTYHIQVRCKPDHGFWSEWSSASYVTVPDYFHREKSTWILITVFCAFIFLILTWLLHMNSHSLKHCILPPVPGPKIRGFDKQLLKSGKSEDIFNALVVSGFPPTSSSNCEDLLEYLEVYVPEEQELMLEETKGLRESGLKSDGSASDNDSGRGSCDSPTLLMDKCRRSKEERMGPEESLTEAQRHQREWSGGSLPHRHENLVSPNMSGGRVKTWPSVFSPLPQYGSGPLSRMSSLEMVKQHRLSDSVFPQSSSTSCLSRHRVTDGVREGVTDGVTERVTEEAAGLGLKNAAPQLLPPAPVPRPTEYVEVQRVNEEDMVLLQPLEAGCCRGDGCPRMQTEDYSKVKAVNGDNALLLQREAEGGGRVTQKPAACTQSATPTRGHAAPTVSGYVDTATAFALPAF